MIIPFNKIVTLLGGWNSLFTTQDGISTIDGQNARRGIVVNGKVTASLDRFDVKNGQTSDVGGGIYNWGNLTFTNGSIENNSAIHGGGIYNSYYDINSDLTLNNTTLRNNSASNNGGGIYNVNILTLNNSTLSNNLAQFGGGGIYSQSSLTINNSTFNNNSATSGGGI